jgi:hypothetical protein
MALTKTAPQTPATDAAAAVKPVGTFESMDETTAGATAANDIPAETATSPAPAAQPAEPTSIATKPAGAVVVARDTTAFQKEVAEMKGAADFAHGNFAVFKGQNGEIKQTGGATFGRWVKVSMVAWDDHHEISPGSDSEASKLAVGYSKDGKTVDSIIGRDKFGRFIGQPVADYVKFLQEDGDYPNAKVGRFIDVGCVVHESESTDAFNGEIVQISLSQSSIPSFSSYQEQLVMKAKALTRKIPGIKVPENPFDFYFVREAAEKNGKSWTKLKVLTSLPKELAPKS